MKIRDGIKFGIGYLIAQVLFYGVTNVIERASANDDEYMERLKERKPDLYKRLLKYRKD